MPTKTRLDPTAGGASPPAEQDGAHGSGRGDHSTSASAAPGAPADVAGFIDSLASLSEHVTQREAFEADVRRGWSKMAGACGLLVALETLAGPVLFAPSTLAVPPLSALSPPATTSVALYVATVGTGALAALLFSAAGASPWREAADHVDRLALRHEDSPLRDRIRITQWILFDACLSRFSACERRVNAIIAHGVMLVSVMGALSLALNPAFRALVQDPADLAGRAGAASLFTFLVLTLVAIAGTMRSGKEMFATAQHYARQVLAFDEDFGGFLPRAEKERVQRVAENAAGTARAEP